jgi:hypothetical protein
MLSSSQAMAAKGLFVAIAAVVSIAGCVPLPGNSQYQRYEIDLSANGRHYTFQQFFRCYQQAEFSAADGNFHPTTRATGVGTTAADIGDGLVLLFEVQGCNSNEKTELPKTAKVLVNPNNPERIYSVIGILANPSIVINHVIVEPFQGANRELGPTPEQVALKEQVRDHQRGFQRVRARVIPYQVWATSDQSRAYFGHFQSVAVAKVGDAPPASGWPDQFVQFQFWKERAYQTGSDGRITGLSEFELVYNGEAFEVPDRTPDPAWVWYSTEQTRNDHPIPHYEPKFALVIYKGTLIRVKKAQEIFDPQTKNILLLVHWYEGYPWGGPDEIDVKRLMAQRK